MAKQLTNLDLGGNPLRAAFSNHCPGLEVLRLRQTGLGLDGVRGLAHREPASGLRVVDLFGNRLGPASVKLLVESALELTELDVRGCGLEENSIQRLEARFGEALRADPSSRRSRTCG